MNFLELYAVFKACLEHHVSAHRPLKEIPNFLAGKILWNPVQSRWGTRWWKDLQLPSGKIQGGDEEPRRAEFSHILPGFPLYFFFLFPYSFSTLTKKIFFLSVLRFRQSSLPSQGVFISIVCINQCAKLVRMSLPARRVSSWAKKRRISQRLNNQESGNITAEQTYERLILCQAGVPVGRCGWEGKERCRRRTRERGRESALASQVAQRVPGPVGKGGSLPKESSDERLGGAKDL